MRKRTVWLFSLLIMLTLILTGCFKGEQTNKPAIDPPVEEENLEEENNEEGDELNQDSNENSEEENSDTDSNQSSESVARQLYLIDVNGKLAAQTLELPSIQSKEVATQVLEHLVKGGPVTSMLPNGFQAILPEGTEIIGINVKEDGTAVVDVSEEFKNYEADDELAVIQSITYTLTQFDSVDKVQLWINGHPQDVMPVNGTPIGKGYSRTDGINLVESHGIDFMKSEAVTMFFPAEYNENRYYVPVTKHVNTDDVNMYESIVTSLITGPNYNLNMTHVFNDQTLLLNEPNLNDGVLELVFNQEILKDADKSMIADEVMETLVRTLTEHSEVEAVNVKVEDVEQLMNENGESYDEPVTAQEFVESEKI